MWRADILALLLGLLVSVVAVENLKKFPILMPHVRPEKVSILRRVRVTVAAWFTSPISSGGSLTGQLSSSGYGCHDIWLFKLGVKAHSTLAYIFVDKIPRVAPKPLKSSLLTT